MDRYFQIVQLTTVNVELQKLASSNVNNEYSAANILYGQKYHSRI
jgi:hypothetical protein